MYLIPCFYVIKKVYLVSDQLEPSKIFIVYLGLLT